MKNNLEDKNSYKSLTFNQFLCWAEDPPSSLVDFFCEVIANPINCVGVMGGGLALAFKKKYPEHFETYKKMCQNGEIKVGELYVVDGDEKHKVLLFPTKIHWKNPSLMEYVESGLEYLVKNYDKMGIKSIAIPALGCGLGGMKWEDVKEKIISILSEIDDKVEIEIYEPFF